MNTNTISAGNTFSYTVPKLSVTVIELDVSELGPITAPVLCGVVQDSAGNAVANARLLLMGRKRIQMTAAITKCPYVKANTGLRQANQAIRHSE